MSKRRKIIFSILFLGLTLWIGRFLLAGKFGFYEDDYTLVVRGMVSTWDATREFFLKTLLNFEGQGRPLQHSLLFMIARIAGGLGGLWQSYVIAYAIVLLNCSLFFEFIRRTTNHEFALLAALFYTLYAADTTQTFLYHGFGLQQSLTFFLLAGLAFNSRNYLLSYVLILGSLLSYENTYFVFLGVPFLILPWDKHLVRKFIIHSLVLIILFAAVVALRIATGEGRVSSLSMQEIVLTPLIHMVQGPIVAVGTNFLRPLQAIQSMEPAVFVMAALGFGVFITVLKRSVDMVDPISELDKNQIADSMPHPDLGYRSLKRRFVSSSSTPYIRIFLVGSLMLLLAYPLTFTVRAFAISGRDTRVHLGAVIGYSLFWASVWWIIIGWLKKSAKQIALVLLAMNLALLLGFGLVIQKDYAKAWRLQQELWQSILWAVPDLEDGMVILIDPAGLEDTQYIDANTWALPRAFQYIYEFPQDWEDPPMVYRLLPDWQARLLHNDEEIKAVDYSWTYIVERWEKTVILETDHNRVSGRKEGLVIEGKSYNLNPISQRPQVQIGCGYLFDLLIDHAMNDGTEFCSRD